MVTMIRLDIDLETLNVPMNSNVIFLLSQQYLSVELRREIEIEQLMNRQDPTLRATLQLEALKKKFVKSLPPQIEELKKVRQELAMKKRYE